MVYELVNRLVVIRIIRKLLVEQAHNRRNRFFSGREHVFVKVFPHSLFHLVEIRAELLRKRIVVEVVQKFRCVAASVRLAKLGPEGTHLFVLVLLKYLKCLNWSEIIFVRPLFHQLDKHILELVVL